jgi:hypothetical protein
MNSEYITMLQFGGIAMPIRVGWYVKGRIFLIEAKGVVTDEEYLSLGNSPIVLQAMDNSPAAEVHYFFDIVDPHTKMPSLRVRGKTAIEKHKKDGWTMLIHFKMNPLWRMTATIIAQVGRGHFRFMETQEEAFTFMRLVDHTLPAKPDPVTEWLHEFNWTVAV